MKFLTSAIKKVAQYFGSGKAEADMNKAAALLPTLIPVVKAIAAATPTRTDDEIVAVFSQFAVPLAAEVRALPDGKKGLALLDLATQVGTTMYPNVSTRVLQTAIQMAVVGAQD